LGSVGNFLNTWWTANFLGRTLFHGLSKLVS
jgi:hypothetical protein